jgi:hypothetical protein
VKCDHDVVVAGGGPAGVAAAIAAAAANLDAFLSGTGTVNRLTLNSGGALKPYDTGGGVPSTLKVTGALDIANGTLDLSGIASPASGDLVLAQCGSLVGSSFASVVGNASGRSVTYTTTSVVLKAGQAGTVFLLR